MKINCIIIEDEPLAQKLIEDYISQTSFLKLCGIFTNPVEAVPFLKSENIDLIFLDIEMPKINGMDFLDILDDRPEIIFTTAYSNYAVKSYEKNALDYLLKPINFERFLSAVNKHPLLTKEMKTAEPADGKSIFIKSDKNLIRLNYSDIYFIEALKDYVIFQTEKEKFIVYHTLKKLEGILPKQFIRVHYSHIVNTEKIQKIKDNQLYILNIPISVGSKYKDGLMEIINRQII